MTTTRPLSLAAADEPTRLFARLCPPRLISQFIGVIGAAELWLPPISPAVGAAKFALQPSRGFMKAWRPIQQACRADLDSVGSEACSHKCRAGETLTSGP